MWKLGDVRRVLYRLPELLAGVSGGRRIFLAEGEKDVDALVRAGEVATTMPGGVGKWRPEYEESLKGAAEVIVIADRDAPGRAHALQVASSLRHVTEVRVVEPVFGKDVSDHLAVGHSVDELVPVTDVLDTADVLADDTTPAGPGPLSVRWVADVLADPPPQPPVLVDGLLRAGEMCVLGALRALGKSWWAMNLATMLGRGEGLFCGGLRIRRTCRVLIAQGELDEWGSWQRWQRLCGTDGPPPGVAETFDRWRIRVLRRRASHSEQGMGSSEEWTEANLDERLEATIGEHSIDVLIIDPWRVYFAGAENSNDEVEAGLERLRALTMRTGVAVVILHHLGKASEAREPEDLWRGASRLADWASTRVTMLPHYSERQAQQQGMTRQQARRYVDLRFLRRAEPTEDFSMVWNPETGWWERWANPAEAADARRIHLNPVDVAATCRESGGDWPSVVVAADALGVSQGTARGLLAAAVRAELLERYEGPRGAAGHRLPEGAECLL